MTRPSGRDYLAVFHGRARMEHDAPLNVADALDGVAFGVFFRIAAADEHHADGCARVEFDVSPVKVAFGHAFEQVNDVALEAEHHALRFGVAHAAVVFDDHRVAAYVDKAEEDEALIV